MELDKNDAAIISVLIANSRLSLRKIAKKCGLSVATVMNRIKRLEENKAIRGYSAKIDYDKLGFELQAIIEINVAKGKLFEVEKRIASHPNVCSVYDVTGHYDVVVVAKFKTRSSLDGFVKKIQTFEFVQKTETAIILNTIKEEQVKF